MIRIAVIACLVTFATVPARADWVADYGNLLAKYVSPSGVAYKKWKASSADLDALDSVVDAIAAEKLAGMSRDEQLAFYLNAYNGWILKRILQDYPTAGPGNGSKLKRAWFFRSKSLTVAGEKTSFSNLENDLIRPRFKEPRIHFALNCASASCPPLPSKPFTAAALDTDLDTLARAYLNANPFGLRLSKDNQTAHLSEIFTWYAEDFQPNALTYINQYRDDKLPASTKIDFQPYDWSLNETR